MTIHKPHNSPGDPTVAANTTLPTARSAIRNTLSDALTRP